MKAQLAFPIETKELFQYMQDENWWFEQKLDGERLMVHVEDGKVSAINRKGSSVGLDKTMETMFTLPRHWMFDGEYVNGTFWMFDLIAAPGLDESSSFAARRRALESCVAILDFNERAKIVPVARTTQEKGDLIKWCMENRSEGIMLKDSRSHYHLGKRTKSMLKLKFWESCDAVVTEVGREGKRSCAVSLWEEGLLIDVGSVAVTEHMLQKLKEGDVIEVKYLYAFPDTKRLYQPSFLRLRTDKDSQECSIDQMKYLNKEVFTNNKGRNSNG